VTVWNPPRRFSVRAEGPDGFINQLEFTIETRGDGAILRYVHSGVIDDANWDDQYDAVNSHTAFYLHTLGQYLEHFSPRTATYMGGGPVGVSIHHFGENVDAEKLGAGWTDWMKSTSPAAARR
jgi:hypothetical protein